ncbi:MAG: hypothetical protein J6037_00900, partial [Bacteroidales bacterium]|nr:hypothetical protein [Bacteroidales bacterium]
EDGLAGRQKAISEYILTLDPKDSLRETMGLYFALGGLDPSHFAPYMFEGDYLHGQQQEDITRQHGPQVRQLMREGFLSSEDFENYAKALPVGQRLQLMMDILVGLADLKEEREAIHRKIALWFDDADPEKLSAQDAFALSSIIAGNSNSEPTLEKSLAAARRAKDLGYAGADRLVSMAASLLIMTYQKHGKVAEAEALRQDISQGGRQNARDRFTALTPLLIQAGTPSKLVSKKQRAELLDKFFEEYYKIVDSLEVNQENFLARYKSGDMMLNAFAVLYDQGMYERQIEEILRFMPSMELFYKVSNYFSRPDSLYLFLFIHMMLVMSTTEWLKAHGYDLDPEEPEHLFHEIRSYALIATAQGAELLKDVDPDNSLINMVRGNLGNLLDRTEEIRDKTFNEDFQLKDIDSLIEKAYEEYVSQKN